MIGRVARTHSRYGGTSSIAADSGPAIAMFFGTISPSSTCSTTTIVIATTNDTVCSTAAGTPKKSNGRSSRSATAGSPTRPSRIEHTVMPSCAPASISDRFSPARITVTALRLPCSARASSRSRRAEISANSAPTKNPFATSSKTVSSTPSTSPPIGNSFIGPAGAGLHQLEQVDAPAFHPLHGGSPAQRLVQLRVGIESRQRHGLALHRNVAEFLQHQPADGVVLTLGRSVAGGRGDLVGAQKPRHQPPVAGDPDIRGGVVVLVAHVADDLLDEVLDGHHAGDAAVLIGDQSGLQSVRPDLRHQRVAVQRRRDGRHPLGQRRQLGFPPVGRGHLENLLEMHYSDRLVEVSLDDREPRVAGLHR